MSARRQFAIVALAGCLLAAVVGAVTWTVWCGGPSFWPWSETCEYVQVYP